MDVQSTDLNRTIQTAYAEILGFNDQNNNTMMNFENEKSEKTIFKKGVFKIRREKTMETQKGENVIFPIKTEIDGPKGKMWLDQCKYSSKIAFQRYKKDKSEKAYQSLKWIKDDLKEPFRQYFDLNQTQVDSMSVHNAYKLSDIILS